VILTGTGGCGKTQLALLVATSLLDSFADSVWLVDLAPAHAAQLVSQAALAALGVRERLCETPPHTLVGWLGGRRLLLVVDNCEHLIDGCAQLAAAVLDACPNLRLLTTSREPLRISGERVWRVSSLDIPEPQSILAPDQVTQFPSVQLFVQRAQAVQSDFTVTPRNAATVAAICARLGGCHWRSSWLRLGRACSVWTRFWSGPPGAVVQASIFIVKETPILGRTNSYRGRSRMAVRSLRV
jgi:non-specific serine/threonine protein kinase